MVGVKPLGDCEGLSRAARACTPAYARAVHVRYRFTWLHARYRFTGLVVSGQDKEFHAEARRRQVAEPLRGILPVSASQSLRLSLCVSKPVRLCCLALQIRKAYRSFVNGFGSERLAAATHLPGRR